MSDKSKRDLSASVRQRLLNISQERKDPFDLILSRYAIERLLYRLSHSQYADRFSSREPCSSPSGWMTCTARPVMWISWALEQMTKQN